jgi:hypothetical protein
MTFNYSGIGAVALKQINDKGRDITVRYAGNDQVYNPATDTFTAGTDVDVPVKGVFTQFAKKDIDGELIKVTDKRVLIAGTALDNAPENNSKIIDGGIEYQVINTETIQPSDTVVLYMVQVRR